jgi:hypothetical protein
MAFETHPTTTGNGLDIVMLNVFWEHYEDY